MTERSVSDVKKRVHSHVAEQGEPLLPVALGGHVVEEVPPLRHHVVVALVVHARVPDLHMEVWPHKHIPRGQVVVDKAMLSEETLQVSRNGIISLCR